MQLVGYAGARTIEKSQSLRMTALLTGLHAAGWICRQHERIEKLTVAQDDGFVGGLGIQLVGYADNTKGSKSSQPLRMTALSGP
jgi:hypothetical protein